MTPRGRNPEHWPEPAALRAGDGEIETPEGDVLYLNVVPDLSAPFDLVADGIELRDTSTFQAIGEMVFAAPNDSPTITRFVVDDSDRLERGATLSFAGLGVTTARDYALISETKAYLFDYEAYKVHVWNPTEMTLSGVEIDLSAARHDERGPLWLAPWRFDHLWRGDQLLTGPLPPDFDASVDPGRTSERTCNDETVERRNRPSDSGESLCSRHGSLCALASRERVLGRRHGDQPAHARRRRAGLRIASAWRG